jgi:anti-sigma factor RsiW
MNDNDFFELINLRLDGEISPEDDARLEAHLESNPESRKTYEHMVAVSGSLAKVRDVEPPASLKAGIMRDVDARLAAGPKPGGVWDHVKDFWRMVAGPSLQPRFAFAGGVAVGILILVAGLAVLNTPELDQSRLVGTILPPESVQSLNQVATIPIETDVVSGEIESAADGSHIAIKLSLHAEQPVSFDLTYEPGDFAFRGLSDWQASTQPVTITAGSISVSSIAENAYTILLQRLHASVSDPVVVIHTSNGDLRYPVSVTVSK